MTKSEFTKKAETLVGKRVKIGWRRSKVVTDALMPIERNCYVGYGTLQRCDGESMLGKGAMPYMLTHVIGSKSSDDVQVITHVYAIAWIEEWTERFYAETAEWNTDVI